ncbi:alpha/beta hydrolase fold domain-containing protein [Actinoplanes awajinensis]|uniref:alpha/beta hydrolase fold domain-containing protein n=1 Tax=Actinoplanes awajinensis TaxID=135946 RepID=UPI0018DE42B6|nr:alpha/beta hydrolase fold domain-containing protein [Actinoplanes awajinensis]
MTAAQAVFQEGPGEGQPGDAFPHPGQLGAQDGAAHLLDPCRIAIAGDSSGGNLAAAVTIHDFATLAALRDTHAARAATTQAATFLRDALAAATFLRDALAP